jgi:hypothetical protein
LFTRPLRMRAIHFSGTSGTTHPATQHHVPEDPTSQLHHWVNFETHKFCILWGLELGEAGMCSKPNILFELHTSSGLWSGWSFWRSTGEVLSSHHMGSTCQSTKWDSRVSIIPIYVILYLHYVPSLRGFYCHTCLEFHLSIRWIVNTMSYHHRKTLSLSYLTGIDWECTTGVRPVVHRGLAEGFWHVTLCSFAGSSLSAVKLTPCSCADGLVCAVKLTPYSCADGLVCTVKLTPCSCADGWVCTVKLTPCSCADGWVCTVKLTTCGCADGWVCTVKLTPCSCADGWVCMVKLTPCSCADGWVCTVNLTPCSCADGWVCTVKLTPCSCADG